MEFTAPVTAAGLVKSTGIATKLGDGKSCWEMLREAPTTFATVARKRCVMKEPRPPFAPVMKMTLSLMWIRILDSRRIVAYRGANGEARKNSQISGPPPVITYPEAGECDVVLDKAACPLLNAVASFFGNAYRSRVGIIDVRQNSPAASDYRFFGARKGFHGGV